jgi:hypothetical protein
MTIEEAVVQRLRTLPAEKKQEVLDFVEFLGRKSTATLPRRNPIGMFADLKIEISAEEIAQLRQEMWGAFPRDIDL